MPSLRRIAERFENRIAAEIARWNKAIGDAHIERISDTVNAASIRFMFAVDVTMHKLADVRREFFDTGRFGAARIDSSDRWA